MYWKLAFGNTQLKQFRAARSALLVAICLIPILLAVGVGYRPPAANHASTDREIARPSQPEGATLRPLFRRFARAFLISCAAITFLSTWADVRARKYEFGVLRFLGASKNLVFGLALTEAVVSSLAGALLAIVISQSLLACLNFISAAAPQYSVGFKWYLAASSTVISAAICGSTIPFAISIQQDVLHMVSWDR